ncbi:glycosyltransferase [Pannonibacter sp.]|uniref:glycosyltransferase n=1 Tax=Pannonibacter sp. TaxID=1906786 RepID=UPI003F6F4745
MKILHVSEAFGGGIVTSIKQFARATPELEHHLLINVREQDRIDTNLSHFFRTIYSLPRSKWRIPFSVTNRYRELSPNFVHLHSSFAGAFGRLALVPGEKIVYSPHGFSFHRTNESKIRRYIYFQIEKALSVRTSRFVGVSEDEVQQGLILNHKMKASFVPNVSPMRTPTVKQIAPIGKLRIVLIGRVCAQKDPFFLIECLNELDPLSRSSIEVTWVGGGDPILSRELMRAGVKVTGWVSEQDVLNHLSASDVYLHTAAWEGFPMTVVEAAAAGIPVLLRSIPAFSCLRPFYSEMPATPRQMAGSIENILNSTMSKSPVLVSELIRSIMTEEKQSEVLRNLYSTGATL